jgi:hypothetical protein
MAGAKLPTRPTIDLSQPGTKCFQQAFPIRNDEIRVFDVLPGSGLEPITLEGRVLSLSSADGFEALSYVWGNLKDIHSVKVSGYDLEITYVLYAALRQLRQTRERRTLWVDQICINQTDDDEKSHQVSLMRTIYKRCHQCVIWFGEIPSTNLFSEEDAAVALDFIQATADGRAASNTTYDSDTHILLTDTDQGDRARNAFRTLIMGGNPWWSRVWTLQEASLPNTAILHWGPLKIPLETIELAAKTMVGGWFCGVPSSTKVAEEYRDLVSSFLYPVRGITIARNGETPLNTLMRWRYRKATDPRDKVYGFAGLFKADTLLNLPALRDISYTISPEILFARVTRDLICFDQDLRPLVGARELPHVTPGLPTWAIDFASSSDIGPRQTRWWQHSHRYHRWTACTSFDEFKPSADENTLVLSGRFVDEVQEVGKVYHIAVNEEAEDRYVRAAIIANYHLFEEYLASRNTDVSADYVGGGALKDAFWRTMLGNLIMSETPRGVPHDYDIVDFEEYVAEGSLNRLTLSLHGLVPNHAFFITTKGYVGMGPSDLNKRDCVYVFGGGRVPFVIRPADNVPDRYHLMGDAYVHGIMRGETSRDATRPAEVIKLI